MKQKGQTLKIEDQTKIASFTDNTVYKVFDANFLNDWNSLEFPSPETLPQYYDPQRDGN
ncbi:hypothetical protein ABDD95_18655 [Mucilaginibacter sp. PAMB04274]|uniref:hypothetical protein n=1 Tax=Mucilaginibacter sp. PAMB04274 TaxID=3138568 RepID=UPI0031F66EBE